MKAAIHTEQLGKTYRVQGRHFRALHDVNLDVAPGEALGLIGANGAGKSTLLKVLSGITHPSVGSYSTRGRITSLLEVGTGFHPDLSGRENIYLSAALHGMSRPSIAKKLDAIVDFSGVESFLDSPIKHYSSGMKVRLGFALAAHLDADIMLIDEVLAVGDAAFQAKCLDRMSDQMQSEGRTVLFVSHNMFAVSQLCDRTAWIDGGQIREIGHSQEMTQLYLNAARPVELEADLTQRDDRKGEGQVQLTRIAWDGPLQTGRAATLRVHYRGSQPLKQANLRLSIEGHDGRFLAPLSMHSDNARPEQLPAEGVMTYVFDALPLMAGDFQIRARLLVNGLVQDDVRPAMRFHVQEGIVTEGGDSFSTTKNGIFLPGRWLFE